MDGEGVFVWMVRECFCGWGGSFCVVGERVISGGSRI